MKYKNIRLTEKEIKRAELFEDYEGKQWLCVVIRRPFSRKGSEEKEEREAQFIIRALKVNPKTFQVESGIWTEFAKDINHVRQAVHKCMRWVRKIGWPIEKARASRFRQKKDMV